MLMIYFYWHHQLLSLKGYWGNVTKNSVTLIWLLTSKSPHNQMIYLGVFFVKSRVFKCDLDHVWRSFHRAANAIFGRIGRIASEEVIIQLIKSKCIPVLVYGLEVCPLTKSDLKTLDFSVNRFFMKLFNTSNIQMVNDCQVYFGFDLPSVIIDRQSKKFRSVNATYTVS